MTAGAPEIGFDRFIRLEWIAAALRVRIGESTLDDLDALLDEHGLAREASAKTRTKLNALALRPREDVANFIDRGIDLFASAHRREDVLPFAWGAAIATFPYFGRVAEFTGRLTSIQGDCSVTMIHRRMSEVYGDRQITKRATQAVLQTQTEWGVIRRVNSGRRLVRSPATCVSDEPAIAWLIEAALRYYRKAVALSTMQASTVIYPFKIGKPLGLAVSNCESLELRSEGSSQHVIAIRSLA